MKKAIILMAICIIGITSISFAGSLEQYKELNDQRIHPQLKKNFVYHANQMEYEIVEGFIPSKSHIKFIYQGNLIGVHYPMGFTGTEYCRDYVASLKEELANNPQLKLVFTIQDKKSYDYPGTFKISQVVLLEQAK